MADEKGELVVGNLELAFGIPTVELEDEGRGEGQAGEVSADKRGGALRLLYRCDAVRPAASARVPVWAGKTYRPSSPKLIPPRFISSVGGCWGSHVLDLSDGERDRRSC